MSEKSELTPESVHRLMQNNNINQLIRNYKAFLDSLANMPMMKQFSNRALQHLEDGLLWLKEAINTVPPPRVQPQQPESETSIPKNDAPLATESTQTAQAEPETLPADAA